jgi:hypothetical protein
VRSLSGGERGFEGVVHGHELVHLGDDPALFGEGRFEASQPAEPSRTEKAQAQPAATSWAMSGWSLSSLLTAMIVKPRT